MASQRMCFAWHLFCGMARGSSLQIEADEASEEQRSRRADPIADKALIGAALIGLSMLGDLPWWVTAVIMAREIGVTVLRFVVLRHGVIPASRGGKLKTLVQAVAIGLFVLPLSGTWLSAAWVVMWAAVVLTVITGVDYVISAVRDSRGRPAGH